MVALSQHSAAVRALHAGAWQPQAFVLCCAVFLQLTHKHHAAQPLHALWLLQVPAVVLLENSLLREAADLVVQPWFRLFHFLSSWRPDVDMAAWAHSTKGLAAHPQGYARQLDAVAALCPAHMSHDGWSMLIQERLRQGVRGGYQWEEMVTMWVAMFCLIMERGAPPRAAAPAAAAGGGGAADAPAGAEGERGRLPGLDEFLLAMLPMEGDPAAQLDVLATYRPPSMSEGEWDIEVGKVRPAAVDSLSCRAVLVLCTCRDCRL